MTREKLQILETFYAEHEQAPAENPFVNERSQRSLKRMIDQIEEEIARFEAKVTFPDRADPSKLPEPSSPLTDRG